MTQQRRGGLGRGLAALIPTSTEQNPRLGDGAADVILGPYRDGRPSAPPRPKSLAGGLAGADTADSPAEGDGSSAEAAGDGERKKSDKKKSAKKGEKKSGDGGAAYPQDTTSTSREVSRETSELVDPGAVYREIPVAAIEPNPKQPRSVFDEEALAELAHSVKEFGLLQPIVVREVGEGRYQLIMGERRWRASQRAELEQIPAIVRQTDDEELLRDALLENIHRVQLNPLEEAAAYQQLLEEFGVTQSELATRIGRSRPAITNSIRLLQLSTPVQRRVAAGVLSAGHARALLGLESGAAAQDELAARIVAEGLSVRATEELVTLANREAPRSEDAKGPRSTRRVSKPEWEAMASGLADRLETSVSVSMGRRKGRITIDVGDEEDLRRVMRLLGQGS